MRHLRVIDQHGNKTDYETDYIPRIGERIELRYGRNNQPVTDHYFRVKDVSYWLENPPGHQVMVLVEEEKNPKQWPS